MEIALIYFAVLAVAFFLLIVRPRRRQAVAHRELVATLAVGDEVMSAGGIFGTVRELQGDDVVVLEIAPATTIRVARGAIAQRIPPVAADPPGGQPDDHQVDPGS
jgi:preprotein translocase subunit YajC